MKSPELTEFFSLLGKAKKEKKEEFDNLLKEADINLDVLTSTVVSGIKEAKVNIKKQKKKESKLIEQLDSIIDVIENPKEVKDIVEPAVTVGVPEDFDVSKLEEDPITVQDWNNGEDIKFTEVDAVNIIEPEPIKTPEISDTVAQAIKFIEETNLKEEIENSDETSIENLKGEIKQVRDILYKVLAHGPGSGEVNLLKLDDVDEDSAKVDGKFLKYESSSGKFVGGDASGGSGIGTNGSVNTVGIITAAQFSGFSHLIAPYGSTTTITVAVASKTSTHRYYGTGSSSAYVLDNVQSPFLTLTPGRTYRFSGSVAGSHPFRFYLDAAKATQYSTGVTVGSGYVDLEVTDSTPTVLHYQCSSHGYMGNAIQVNSSNAIQLNSQAASYYLNYNNFSNTPTIPSNNNQLTNGAGFITTSFTSYNQLSDTPTIPTNNNQLTNGSNFITASANITGTSAGLTGTPSITINGLNAATGTFSGNVTVGGVLTYEDVTNVDSIGIVTARAGVLVGSGITLSKDGDIFATGITSSTKVHVGVDTGVYGEDLVVTGDARVTGILTIGTGSIVLDPTAKQLRGLEEIVIGIANTITIKQDSRGEIEFTDAVGTPKSVGIGTTVSINTSGIVTASSFVGDGSSLTGIEGGVTSDAQFNTVGGTQSGDAFDGTSATRNTLYGYGSGTRINSGDDNTHFGYNAGSYTTSNTGTTYIGSRAGEDATGMNNTGVGNEALKKSTASNNTAVGQGAGSEITSGNSNVLLGRLAGNAIVGGSDNVILGYNADVGASSNNNIVIGYDVDAGSISNEIVLGNSDHTKFTVTGIGATFDRSGAIIVGVVTATSFVGDGSALTGIAGTDNIRTNTNATFLQNVNVSGTTTATTFIGDLTGDVTGDVTGTASNATLAVSAQGLTGSPTITITNVNAVDAVISGNLSVAGTITSLDQNDILATGIITASSGVDLGDPGIVTLSSNTLTTTSTSADTISSISATVNRSATFQVQVTRGTQYHMTTINVIHNGTVAFMSEYGTIRTGAVLATFDADINSGNLRLRATPTSADSTVFKLSKTTIKV